MRNPVREGNTASGFQNPIRFGHGAPLVGHMKQRFLADHDIHAAIRQRHLHNVGFNYAHTILQANEMG